MYILPEIAPATSDDIEGILKLQEKNLLGHGGHLSVRLPRADRRTGEIFRHVEPEDLLKYGLILRSLRRLRCPQFLEVTAVVVAPDLLFHAGTLHAFDHRIVVPGV